MHQLNLAFLMKLGWRLKAEPSALWAWFLKATYCKGRDLDNVVARRYSCSNVWRGIVETLDLTGKEWGSLSGMAEKPSLEPSVDRWAEVVGIGD